MRSSLYRKSERIEELIDTTVKDDKLIVFGRRDKFLELDVLDKEEGNFIEDPLVIRDLSKFGAPCYIIPEPLNSMAGVFLVSTFLGFGIYYTIKTGYIYSIPITFGSVILLSLYGTIFNHKWYKEFRNQEEMDKKLKKYNLSEFKNVSPFKNE